MKTLLSLLLIAAGAFAQTASAAGVRIASADAAPGRRANAGFGCVLDRKNG